MKGAIAGGTAIAILAGCATIPQGPAPVGREAFDNWMDGITFVEVPTSVLNGRCGFAPPQAPYKTVLLAHDCVPLPGVTWAYIKKHETAHTWAYAHDLWMTRPGETCDLTACPGAERAAEAVLRAVGIKQPTYFTNLPESMGYGASAPDDIIAAKATLWES